VKLQRIISFATLGISIITLVLVLKRPAPVAPAAAPAVAAANAQSFQEKVNQLAQPKTPGQGASEVRMNSAELSGALAEAAGLLPSAATANASTSSASGSASGTSPASPAMEFPGAVPNIKDYQVSMEGDIVRGQFLTQIAGKDVYLTLAGHLGAKDGYATFDATEVKVGDLPVPVALVNEVLQKKLTEQRDQLKLPNNVKDIKVENGELVFVEK
jgi:hypothetical protein